MTTIFGSLPQSSNEIKVHAIDFTLLIPTGGTITAGTATHTPPGGGTATTVTTQVTSPYVYITAGPLTTIGVHFIEIKATLNDGEELTAFLPLDVGYETNQARAGMGDLIRRLRNLAEAGSSDYTLSSQIFWTDNQLQEILDQHKVELIYEPMTVVPGRISGGYEYKNYYISRKNLEKTTGGTAIFYIQDGSGTTVSSSLYTVDYFTGKVTFTADQGGAVSYFVNAASYDLEGAAGEVWRIKASHYAETVNISTDNQSMALGDLYKHAIERAEYFEGRGEGAVTSASLERDDDTY